MTAAVALGLRLALRSARQTDALVLPVLFGITIDESMFLLYEAHRGSLRSALEHQGPLVAATALTISAGFAALIACRFPGLRDLGVVGTVGVYAVLGRRTLGKC